MAKRIPEADLQAIEAAVAAHPLGMNLAEIALALEGDVPRRTLQYRLKHLVDHGRLVPQGEKRWMRYRIPMTMTARPIATTDAQVNEAMVTVPLSPASKNIQRLEFKPA